MLLRGETLVDLKFVNTIRLVAAIFLLASAVFNVGPMFTVSFLVWSCTYLYSINKIEQVLFEKKSNEKASEEE
jgi:hypothetical protein